MEAAAASGVSARSVSSDLQKDEQMHVLLEDSMLQQIIRAGIHDGMKDLVKDVIKRITDVEHGFHERIERLEGLIGDPKGVSMPVLPVLAEMQQSVDALHRQVLRCEPFPIRRLPSFSGNRSASSQGYLSSKALIGGDEFTGMSLPPSLLEMQQRVDALHRKVVQCEPFPIRRPSLSSSETDVSVGSRSPRHTDHGSVSRSETLSNGRPSSQAFQTRNDVPRQFDLDPSSSDSTPQSTMQDLANAQQLLRGRHDGHGDCRVGASMRSEARQTMEEVDLAHGTSFEVFDQTQRQQQHQRGRGDQSETEGRMHVRPESQGGHTSPYMVEHDHDEAVSSESSTAKKKHTGRWPQLMGKKWWQTSHRNA